MHNSKIKWITQTALMLALLIVLQTLTKPLGQIVTGSCVNAVLAVSVLMAGLYSGLSVALLSPFFAFLLGIGHQLFLISPAIAVGNCVLVLVLYWICNKEFSISRGVLACGAAAAAKFIALNLLVVQVICKSIALPEKQITLFSTMFSYPQLITALIGCAIAMLVVPRLKKVIT